MVAQGNGQMNQRVKAVFHEIADLRPEARVQYFAEHRMDHETRAEVNELLAFDSGASAFLMRDIGIAATESLGRLEPRVWRCGPYRLLNIVGRGGMGTVYLAERADGEVTQRLAVKLLPFGAGDPQRERFLQERQILASLAHPNIARMLDAGHIDNGQPFLAMEYIDGKPIEEFAASLDVRQKITLFLKVCAAVAYLHRNLVVHRDLKPSNILVTADGEPKLLDFGIAKMLHAATDATVTSMRVLTPDYASPEQVTGRQLSTATDIYSLGAVLYRLLTGKLPHEFQEHSPEAIAMEVASREVTRPSKWMPALKGDLESILLRALRKDPLERYTTVEQFAEDLQAYLESRTVKARSGNAWYRTRKFVRRYRVLLSAAAIVIASLAIGLFVANRQRAAAQRRFEDVRRLAHIFVFDLNDEVARIEGSTKARDMMVRTGLQYLDNLAGDSGGDLELQNELAAAYMKIGDAQGFPTKPNLGRVDDALGSYRKAGEIYSRIAATNTKYVPDLAVYYLNYAALKRFAHDPKQARELAQSAIQTFDRLRRSQPLDSKLENRYIASWCTAGDIDEDQGDYQRAWAEFSRCGDLARVELNQKASRQALRAVAQATERIGTVAQELGLLEEALRAFDEDESALEKLLAQEPLNPAFRRSQAVLYQFRAILYYDDNYPSFGDARRGLENARHYLDAAEEMVRRDPNNSSARFSRAVAAYRVSVCLRELDANAAVRMARDSLRRFDELIASGDRGYLPVSHRAVALRRLGEAQLTAGEIAEARRSAESALDAQRASSGRSAPGTSDRADLVQALILAAQTKASERDSASAERLFEEAHSEAEQIAQRPGLANLVPLANAERAAGDFYAQRRESENARACYRRLAQLWRNSGGSNDYANRQRATAEHLVESVER
jgi:tetratricopeptide (TPR) repeat protein/predicted Ser/Thr protein kinase